MDAFFYKGKDNILENKNNQEPFSNYDSELLLMR